MPTALKLNLISEEKKELKSLVDDPTTKKTIVKRAKGLLLLDSGKTAEEVAKILHASPNSVSDWHKSFATKGIKGILNTSGCVKFQQKTNLEQPLIENSTSNLDRSDVTSQTSLIATLIEYLSTLAKKVDSPILTSLVLFLNSILALMSNLSTQGVTEYKNAFDSLNVIFDKMATVTSQANNQQNPNVFKRFVDAIIDTPVCNEQDTASTENLAKSQDFIIELRLVDKNTGLPSTSVPMARLALNGDDINFDSPLALASSFSKIRENANKQVLNFMKGVYTTLTKSASLNQVNGDVSQIRKRKCISFGGKYDIYLPEHLHKQLTNTEYVWDPLLLFNIMDAISNMSYRKGTTTINNLLELREDEKINFRTVHHKCCTEGEEIDAFVDNVLLPILEEYGISSIDGSIIDESKLPNEMIHPRLNQQKVEEIKQKIQLAMDEYNKDITDKEEQITDEICVLEQINPTSEEVSVSVDIILVKAQRSTRRKKGQKVTKIKKKRYIQSTVVSITSTEGTMQLVANSTQRALLMALSVMLKHNLLSNKVLVFYTDGQEEINDKIRSIFGFRQLTIKLDFYHLKSKCYQYLTMAMKGGKKNFERNSKVRRKVYARLFVHNIQGALEYLDSIDASMLKNKEYIEKLKQYIQKKKRYMYCYALRKSLHLKNSSNDVETANNRLIADRCKNNGTSWLDRGLNGMRDVRWLHSNFGSEWYFTSEISFNMRPLSTDLQAKNSWLDEHFNAA